MERFIESHPFTRHAVRTLDPTALKLSDFFSFNQFKNSALYQELYRHADVGRMLAFGSSGQEMTTINVTRTLAAKDFTERDRLMMNLLQPHFALAHRNAQRISARLASSAKPLAAYALTPRENEIAHWLAAGKTNPEIALILNVSPRTVEKHMEKILEKIGVENRTSAAVMIANAI
jgi:DNA-binding CsgD family transcriptional regulator